MIVTSTSHHPPVRPQEPLAGESSLEQTKRIAKIIFAALSIISMAIAIVAQSPLIIFTALGASIGSIGAIWYLHQQKNYDDPDTLKSYQKKALEVPLKNTIEEHGWENMLRHKILEPEALQKRLKELAKEDFSQFLPLYEKGVQAAKNLPDVTSPFPPADHYLEEWKSAASVRNPIQIFDNYNLDSLISQGLADPKLKEGHAAYEEAEKTLSKAKETANKDFEADVSPLLEGTALTLELLESAWNGDSFGSLVLGVLVENTLKSRYSEAKAKKTKALEAADEQFSQACQKVNQENKPYLIKGQTL